MGKEWDSFKQGRLKNYKSQPGGKISRESGGEKLSDRLGTMSFNQKANPKCLKCNSYKWAPEDSKCKCKLPQWAIDNSVRDTFIAFMQEVMTEALRVLKPGGHALVWALPRTSHWTATALEDAGFEIRDCVYHIFGSGFPKSTAIDKQIDKMQGAEREVIGTVKRSMTNSNLSRQKQADLGYRPQGADYPGENGYNDITAPATPEAQQWQGYGTALKPSCEVWWNVRKPLTTVTGDEIIAQTTKLLGELLWLLTPVKLAEIISTLNHQGQNGVVSNTAQWIVNVLHMLKSPELSAMMDMFNSLEQAEIYLSIAWLWNSILDGLCSNTNKYTTETVSNLITDLKTLNCWISAIMQENTANPEPDGLQPHVTNAESNSSERLQNSNYTPSLSALGIAGKLITKSVANALVGIAEKLSLDIPMRLVHSVQGNVTTHTEQTTKLPTQSATGANRPAVECWWLVRKPLAESSIAAQVLATGTGGLNIAATRISASDTSYEQNSNRDHVKSHWGNSNGEASVRANTQGRFPSHLLLSHSVWCVPRGTHKVNVGTKAHIRHGQNGSSIFFGERSENIGIGYEDQDGTETIEAYDCDPSCPVRRLDEQSGVLHSPGTRSERPFKGWQKVGELHKQDQAQVINDQGGASRYFQHFSPVDSPDFVPFLYQSKASRRERNAGCEDLPEVEAQSTKWSGDGMPLRQDGTERKMPIKQNTHPTVKPLALMRWLIRLITPPGGTVLDPFAGSGSTLCAAIQENKHFIGIEQSAEYVSICEARIAHALSQVSQPSQVSQEYDCAPECPIRILGEQSGESKGHKNKVSDNRRFANNKIYGKDLPGTHSPENSYDDQGNAARYFQQFPPDSLFAEDV